MKPGLVIGTIVIIFCTVIAAIALSGSSRKYVSFSEARSVSEPCEIFGEVVKPSVKSDMSHLSFTLREEKTGTLMPVVYNKTKPASFDEAKLVKAVGVFSGDHFDADNLLVKCPSKYVSDKDAKAYATGK